MGQRLAPGRSIVWPGAASATAAITYGTVHTALLHLLAILLLEMLGAGVASPVSVKSVDIARTDDAYSVTFNVIVAANASEVRRLLTSYQEWPRLSDNITESHLVAAPSAGVQRISVTLRSCVVGLFRKVIRQVKDLETLADGAGYVTEFVPGQGDFASGHRACDSTRDRQDPRGHAGAV